MPATANTNPCKAMLSDPSFIWFAMSVDGVTYPFDTSLLCKSDNQRKEIRGMVNEYDNAMATRIGEHVANCSDEELGRLVREQIEGYALSILGDE